MEELLEDVLNIQKQSNLDIWEEGLFPSFRTNPYWLYKRPDNNVFFTACIIFTLNQLRNRVSSESQIIIDNITNLSRKNFANYQDRQGHLLYNFYPTKPPKHFGHGFFFHKFKHFQLPHDADDTAMIYLCSDFAVEKSNWLQSKLALHANGAIKSAKNTFHNIESSKVYSTWFGKKMSVELDICVLCNILLWQKVAGLNFDENGKASLKYIEEIVTNNLFFTEPFKASHNYAKPSIIIYHLARLLEKVELKDAKQKVIAALRLLEIDAKLPFYEKVLVSTSLLRLGEKSALHIPDQNYISKQKPLHYFIAGMLSAYENKLINTMAKLSFFHIRWQCDAFQKVLLYENLVLRNN